MIHPGEVLYATVSNRLQNRNIEQVARVSGISDGTLRAIKRRSRAVTLFTLEVTRGVDCHETGPAHRYQTGG